MSLKSPLGQRHDSVLSIKPFRRIWIATSLSSLGDWLSLLADRDGAPPPRRAFGQRDDRQRSRRRRLDYLVAAVPAVRPAGWRRRRPSRPADQHDRRRRGQGGALPI